MVREFFKPSTLGIVMALWLLTVQAGVLTRTRALAFSGPTVGGTTYWHRYGVPTAVEIEIRTRSDRPTVRITRVFWPQLLVVIVGAYCVGMPMGRLLRGRAASSAAAAAGRRGDRAIIILMIIGACLLASGAAAGVVRQGAAPRMQLITMWPSIAMNLSVLAVLVALAVMGWRRWREDRTLVSRGFAVETRR